MGKLFPTTLDNNFYLPLCHRFPDFPMDNIAATTIQKTAQVIERPANIKMGNIHMPMLVWFQRLNETSAFLGFTVIPPPQKSACFEDPVGCAGTDGYDIGINHHVRQSPITFLLMRQVRSALSPLAPIPPAKNPEESNRYVRLLSHSVLASDNIDFDRFPTNRPTSSTAIPPVGSNNAGNR